VEHLASAHHALSAAHAVEDADAADFAAALLERDRFDIVGDAGSVPGSAANDLQTEAGIVHAGVVILGAAAESRALKIGKLLLQPSQREALVPAQIAAARQQIIE